MYVKKFCHALAVGDDMWLEIVIRVERPSDISAITGVTTAAFYHMPYKSGIEQIIVLALRKPGRLTLSLVAKHNGEVIFHVACSPVTISSKNVGWYGLGPISV